VQTVLVSRVAFHLQGLADVRRKATSGAGIAALFQEGKSLDHRRRSLFSYPRFLQAQDIKFVLVDDCQ
jgi:hypothetical protein